MEGEMEEGRLNIGKGETEDERRGARDEYRERRDGRREARGQRL